MSAIAQVPERDDENLVAAVRRGDDRAFEALYERYHRRIAAFVLARVRDHGRAEDITQEVFVSALRAMRGNQRPLAFEPWLYRIARNACIDQHRMQRAEEVPVDDALVSSGHTPDSAVIAKQDLHHLWGAFGGLSDTCHEVLVLREFEGLSYAEIGERLGMSRGAVETSLMRARRRLAAEYDELATGARCRGIQELIAGASVGAGLGRRASNRLARHVSHCQPCRREALAAGMQVTHVPLRRRAAEKIAALLPLPWVSRLLRGRGEDALLRDRADVAAALAGSPASEQVAAGWAKAAALVAVLVAGAGAGGVGTRIAADGEREPPAPRPERSRTVAAAPTAGGTAVAALDPVAERDGAIEERGTNAGRPAERVRRSRDGRAGDRRGARTDRAAAAPGSRPEAGGNRDGGGAAGGAGGAAPGGVGGGSDAVAGGSRGDGRGDGNGGGDGGGSGGGGSGGGGGGSGSSPSAPVDDEPSSGEPLKPVTDGVTKTVGNTVGGLQKTVDGAAQGLNETLDGVNQTLQGSPQGIDETLQGINETVEGATGGLNETLQGATEGLNETLGGLLGPP